jgi:hypothetical protein
VASNNNSNCKTPAATEQSFSILLGPGVIGRGGKELTELIGVKEDVLAMRIRFPCLTMGDRMNGFIFCY